MLDVYSKLDHEPGNIVLSEYSIQRALRMLFEGARGATRAQMAEVLGEPDAELPSPTKFKHTEANGVWIQEGLELDPKYRSTVQERYNAGVEEVDFLRAAEPARLAINRWVADATDNQISDLLQPDMVSNATRLLLANAITFKGAWAVPFEETMTFLRDFHLVDGSSVKVATMFQSLRVRVAQDAGMTLFELPYDGGCSMRILVPQQWSRLDLAQLPKLESELTEAEILVHLPRFDTGYRLDAARLLASMGMPDLFCERADLSGVTPDAALFVSKVIHEARIQTDEKGTTASAATATQLTLGSIPPTVDVDRPFLFWVRCGDVTLFRGRILDPRV